MIERCIHDYGRSPETGFFTECHACCKVRLTKLEAAVTEAHRNLPRHPEHARNALGAVIAFAPTASVSEEPDDQLAMFEATRASRARANAAVMGEAIPLMKVMQVNGEFENGQGHLCWQGSHEEHAQLRTPFECYECGLEAATREDLDEWSQEWEIPVPADQRTSDASPPPWPNAKSNPPAWFVELVSSGFALLNVAENAPDDRQFLAPSAQRLNEALAMIPQPWSDWGHAPPTDTHGMPCTKEAEMTYGCVACADPISTYGMCVRCDNAYAMGKTAERKERIHGPRPNEAQSGPLCPGCGWPRTPQQSHAESCPVARGDGARCHRCGHYETSYERAASLYAHCPSCSRHTRWERVPNDPRTDSAKAWPEMPAWADDTDDDKPLPEDAEIKAAFPTRSERHDLYGEAMRLVGARRSKGGLVALVTWLLLRAEHQRTEPASPEPAWKRMGHDNSERCTTCGANWRNMPVTPCVSLSRQVKDDAASLNSDGAKERIPSQRPETPEVGAYARGVRDALETAALVVELEGAEGTKSLAKSLRAMVTGGEGT